MITWRVQNTESKHLHQLTPDRSQLFRQSPCEHVVHVWEHAVDVNMSQRFIHLRVPKCEHEFWLDPGENSWTVLSEREHVHHIMKSDATWMHVNISLAHLLKVQPRWGTCPTRGLIGRSLKKWRLRSPCGDTADRTRCWRVARHYSHPSNQPKQEDVWFVWTSGGLHCFSQRISSHQCHRFSCCGFIKSVYVLLLDGFMETWDKCYRRVKHGTNIPISFHVEK